MAELLKREFDLLALRIAMDLSGNSPQVNIQLQGHENGQRLFVGDWSVPTADIGLPERLDRSGRYFQGLPFNFPSQILDEIGAAIAEGDYQDRPLWLHLAKPIGYLSLVPWEQLLQPKLGVPMLRLPDFVANPPRESLNRFEVTLCGSTPAAKSQFTVADHLLGMTELLLATVPRRTTVHIFTDVEWFDTVNAEVAQRNFSSDVIVHDPAQASSATVPLHTDVSSAPVSRVQNPWLLWMRDALNGRSIDMVQFLTHGYIMRDSGALALAESPLRNQDRHFARFIDAAELIAFLTQTGAWCAAFSSPKENYSEMGLRLLADTVAQLCPGPVLHYETRLDPQRQALAAAYRFLFDRSFSAPPRSPALFTYCHPSLVEKAEPAIQTLGWATRSPAFAAPTSAEASINAAYAAAEYMPSWVGSSQRYIEQRRQDVERILREDASSDTASDSTRVEQAQLIEDTLNEIELEIVNVLANETLGGY